MDATLARRKKEERKPARKPREAEPAPASTPEPEHAPASGVPLFLRRAPASSASSSAPASADASADVADASPVAKLGTFTVAPADDALEREAESVAAAVASAAPAVLAPSAAPPSAPGPKSAPTALPPKTTAQPAPKPARVAKKASASADPASPTPSPAPKPRRKPAVADPSAAHPSTDAAPQVEAVESLESADARSRAGAGRETKGRSADGDSARAASAVASDGQSPATAARVYKTYGNRGGGSASSVSTLPAYLRRALVGEGGLGTAEGELERDASALARTSAASASAPPADRGPRGIDASRPSASPAGTTPAFLLRRASLSAAPEASSRAEIHPPKPRRTSSSALPSGADALGAEAEDAVPSAEPASVLAAAPASAGAGDADDAAPRIGTADDVDSSDGGGKPADALAAEVARDGLPFAPPRIDRTTALPSSRTSGGDALPDGVRFLLEALLGADLSALRVHKQPDDRETARRLDARAFALGGDIWLGPGESDQDVRLMAHEVAHVLQGDHLLRRAPSTAAKKPKPAKEKGKKPKPGDAGGAAAAPASAPSPAAAAEAVSVPLLIPEPPDDLSRAAKARVGEVKEESAASADAQADMPPAEAVTDGTRASVAEPAAEAAGRAQGELVDELDRQVEPSPEIELLCQRIYAAIRAKRPPDEDELVEAEPEAMANEAGGQLDGNVRGDTERVQGGYDAMGQTPAGDPAAAEQDLETPPASTDSPPVHATQAVPDAVPAKDVSLDADVEASAAKMDDAGMNTEPAQLVESGPIAEAREAQGELATKAAEDPAKVIASQAEARGKAASDMAALQAKALAKLRGARKETSGGVGTQQGGMVVKEAVTRESVGIKAEGIFKQAQQDVRDLLKPLPDTAMERWNTEKAILSREFKDSLAKVKRWIDERHEGIGGAILSGADYMFGLPRWVTREYDAAEKKFGDGVCRVIREISVEVNRVVAACEVIVEQANKEIAKLYTDLPEDLAAWAAGERARFAEKLDGLKTEARTTRDRFNKDLVQRAGSAVQEVRQEIHKLRQEAGGLIGRVLDAVGRFLDDPAKFIIEGLLELIGIPPASFWSLVNRISQVIDDIADDPLGFANNLLSGIAQGFGRFFDRVGTHLVGGFFDWLFSGLGAVGVQLPTDFSVKGIVTFALQLMGISWERVRRLLAKHIGEKNVALLEKAYELVATLMDKGPDGIFEMIKEKLDPKLIIDQIISAGVEFLTEALIRNVSARILLLFNPAGAIVQALEAIYRVLKWVFENAARLFSFVETVVNGMAQVVAGNIGGMAAAVEGALARLIAPVIDFLADYAGLGDLPEKIAEVIKGFQGWVEGILDTVIGFIAGKAKDLLAALGIGKSADEKPPEGMQGDGELGETVSFAAEDGESHKQWVKTDGAQATLWVASRNPGPVGRRLAAWSEKDELEKIPEKEGRKRPRAEARQTLGAAKRKLAHADRLADQLAMAVKTREPQKKIDALDTRVEAAQEELSALLRTLFGLFSMKTDLRLLYAEQIDHADSRVRADIKRYLDPAAAKHPRKLAESWADTMTWLSGDGAPRVRDVVDGPLNNHKFGNAAVKAAFVPALRSALRRFGMDEADITSIDHYVRHRKGLVNSGHAWFQASRAALLSQIWDASRQGVVKAAMGTEVEAVLNRDRFAHLNRPDVRAELEKAKRAARGGWVAVFATGGIALTTSPAAKAPAVLMSQVWQSNGVTPAQFTAQVKAAVVKTIRKDRQFIKQELGNNRALADARAQQIAQAIVAAVASTELWVVRNTDIPRDIEPGPHVIARHTGSRSEILAATYERVAAASANAALSSLKGQIHHFIPLYLGGGSEEENLVSAEGKASVAGTTHNLLHRLIDELEIRNHLCQLPQNKTTLRYGDLVKAFPDDILMLIIGTVYDDGSILYKQTKVKYRADSNTKVIP